MRTESSTVNLVIVGLIVLGGAVIVASTLLALNDKPTSDAMWGALGGAVTGLGAILARTSTNDTPTPVAIVDQPVAIEETPETPSPARKRKG